MNDESVSNLVKSELDMHVQILIRRVSDPWQICVLAHVYFGTFTEQVFSFSDVGA